MGSTIPLWFYGGVAGSLSFFAWIAYATNVGKSLFKVEVTMHPILEPPWSRTTSTGRESSQFDDFLTLPDQNIDIILISSKSKQKPSVNYLFKADAAEIKYIPC